MDIKGSYRFHKEQLEREISRKSDMLERIYLITQRINDSLSYEEKEVLEEHLDYSKYMLEQIDYLIVKHQNIILAIEQGDESICVFLLTKVLRDPLS